MARRAATGVRSTSERFPVLTGLSVGVTRMVACAAYDQPDDNDQRYTQEAEFDDPQHCVS